MCLPYGLVVRISGFHPDGPGSIPGVGTMFYSKPRTPDGSAKWHTNMTQGGSSLVLTHTMCDVRPACLSGACHFDWGTRVSTDA